jgi:hypothetical protein
MTHSQTQSPDRSRRRRGALSLGLSASLTIAGLVASCTLDVGENFQVAEVVYDDGFFYCKVEPMLFAQGCGSGDPGRGESAQGCHFNRQRLRLTDYEPLAADRCQGNEVPGGAPQAAQRNYQSAQLFMEVDPDRSPLLNRPSSAVAHPRVIFESDSPEAELIRTWGTRYASQ